MAELQPDDVDELSDRDEGRRRRRCQRLRPGRIITLAIVFLLLGAFVNIVVAWGFAISINPTDVEDPVIVYARTPNHSWNIYRVDPVGVTWITSTNIKFAEKRFTPEVTEQHPSDVLPAWCSVARTDVELPAGDVDVREDRLLMAAGWPLRAMWCQISYKFFTRSKGTHYEGVRGGISTGLQNWADHSAFHRALPARPVWFGIGLNSVLYAAFIWIPLFAIRQTRRWRRRRRGQCPRCGYPMGESPRCTEFGTPLPGR